MLSFLKNDQLPESELSLESDQFPESDRIPESRQLPENDRALESDQLLKVPFKNKKSPFSDKLWQKIAF